MHVSPKDAKYLSPTVDEESRADYCENVLGGKYSWGVENLVPGCNPVVPGATVFRCCEPRSQCM